MAELILELKNLKKYFPLPNGQSVKAVDGVSLQLFKGETLGLVGESGCGKSTIAYMVVGMYGATEGEIIYKGENLARKGYKRSLKQKGEIQIVFQDPGSSLNSRRNIGKSLELPLKLHSKLSKKERQNRIEELLEMVGLPVDFSKKMPRHIGGGERQLVSVARALGSSPQFIILDEPTSALDVSVQAKVISTLIKLQKQLDLSYLFITHDLSLMRNVATRVAILYLGRLCEVAPTSEFFHSPFHPYTQMLLSSIPVATDEEEKIKPAKIISEGEIPSPVNAPSGCTFHTRCRECMEICRQVIPSMVEIEPNHFVCCHKYPDSGTES
ncbi:MAG TPA: ABC transporter ATP-binding protein [Clostridiaceae bacterium]|nr:ABC transporter ATP-binding protein [Clostridiaceae bacterium]